MSDGWHRLEINGGSIRDGTTLRFNLPIGISKYADAQIDDYGRSSAYVHQPGTWLHLRARFSHPADTLKGTAGFGFWNAPYGDPSTRRLKLPQAVWYFFASPPNDLPFAPGSPGRGWFAATINTTFARALAMIPVSPFALVLNQFSSTRQRIWPAVQKALANRFAPLPIDMTTWHDYYLFWGQDGCRFDVDGQCVLETPIVPEGPLGFVCWLDNQYLILSPRGRARAGILTLPEEQWMEVAELRLGTH